MAYGEQNDMDDHSYDVLDSFAHAIIGDSDIAPGAYVMISFP